MRLITAQLVLSGALLSNALLSNDVLAQSGRRIETLGQPSSSVGAGSGKDQSSSLRERIGVERGDELLEASDPGVRIRAIERLASDASEEAIDSIASAMEAGTAVRADRRTRLAAVRALAPHAGDDEVRKVLTSVLNSVRAGAPESPLDTLVRATAAMALAKHGSHATLTPLLTAVIGRGRTGSLAKQAMLAHPPRELGPISRSFDTMSPASLELMGDLGDPRLIGVLRKQLKRKAPSVQRAAAVALAKLGDGSAAAHARAWLKKGTKADKASRIAAADILMMLDAPGAPAAIAALLGEAQGRAAGLDLASRSLSKALIPTLEAVIKAEVSDAERRRATEILARIGGDDAARVLLRSIGNPMLATTAALGLARNKGQLAHDGLGAALASATEGAPRRLVLRAGVLRALTHHNRIDGLGPALLTALSSADAADRAVGAFGAVALRLQPIDNLLNSEHQEVAASAARAALALGPVALSRVGTALVAVARDDIPSARVIALGAGLLTHAATSGVPTSRLARWAEGGGVLSPLAAMRLAARDSGLFRGRVVRLLAATDPLVRAHVALGLGASPEDDAVSLLVDAYRFEPDPLVRRAIVRALSVRSEKRRIRTLERARDLDPDATVRALSRSALAGRQVRVVASPRGGEAAWISLRANAESQRDRISGRGATLLRVDGVALTVMSAPDGVIIVPGLSQTGTVSLRLSTVPLATGDASSEP